MIFSNRKLNDGVVQGAGLLIGFMAVAAIAAALGGYLNRPASGLASTGGSAAANRVSYIQPNRDYDTIKGLSFMSAKRTNIGIRSI